MRAKEYLQQLKRLKDIIDLKKEMLDKLDNLGDIKSLDYSQEKVKTSHSNEAYFTKLIAEKDELKKRLAIDISNFKILERTIFQQIFELSNPLYVIVLLDKYIMYKSLAKIAENRHYSYDYIKKVHTRALSAFEKRHLKGAL